MTRRIKRTADVELELCIKSEEFVRPPRDAQRNWLLNRALREFVEDLEALDELARRFVPGVEPAPLTDRTQAALADEDIMEDWQIPLMRSMAAAVSRAHGDVLEIGFGRGVAAEFVQQGGVRSHTVIECNDSVVERFETWRAAHPDRDIRLEHGLWQDRLPALGSFDGVLFHTYPLNEDELVETIARSVTFAEHFFESAARHLRPGGVFVYLSNEIDSLSRGHQRALFRHFSGISTSIQPLTLPPDVRDAWWADRMLLVEAVL